MGTKKKKIYPDIITHLIFPAKPSVFYAIISKHNTYIYIFGHHIVIRSTTIMKGKKNRHTFAKEDKEDVYILVFDKSCCLSIVDTTRCFNSNKQKNGLWIEDNEKYINIYVYK